MSRASLISCVLALILFAFTNQTAAASPPDDSAVRSAAIAGKPIIIAKVLDFRLIARGTRSQQLDYRIEVLQTLSGSRKPWLDSVAHYSCDVLQTRFWHRRWTYLFIFDSSDVTMPFYSEPLSQFGSRKKNVIELIQRLKRNEPSA